LSLQQLPWDFDFLAQHLFLAGSIVVLHTSPLEKTEETDAISSPQ